MTPPPGPPAAAVHAAIQELAERMGLPDLPGKCEVKSRGHFAEEEANDAAAPLPSAPRLPVVPLPNAPPFAHAPPVSVRRQIEGLTTKYTPEAPPRHAPSVQRAGEFCCPVCGQFLFKIGDNGEAINARRGAVLTVTSAKCCGKKHDVATVAQSRKHGG